MDQPTRPAPASPAAPSHPYPEAPPSAWRRFAIPTLGLIGLAVALVAFWAAGELRRIGEEAKPTIAVLGPDTDTPFTGFVFRPERPAPDFTLIDHNGVSFTLAEARGQVVLLYFGFTACPDDCPTTLGKIADALRKLGPDAGKVRVLFVGADPERDTPEILAGFVSSFDPRIVGVTGAEETVREIAHSYGIRFFKEFPKGAATDSANYTLAHSNTLLVIDPQGQLRTSFLGTYTPDEIVHDIRVLLDEIQNG